MNGFDKTFAAIKMWGWERTCLVFALFLLTKQLVTFDQALILFLLVSFVGGSYPGEEPDHDRLLDSDAAPKTVGRLRPRLTVPGGLGKVNRSSTRARSKHGKERTKSAVDRKRISRSSAHRAQE